MVNSLRYLFNLLLDLIALFLVLIILILYKLDSALSNNSDKSLEYFSQLISLIPFDLGVHIRRHFYRNALKNCGKKLTVMFGTVFTKKDCIIGDNVFINKFTILGEVNIGNNTIISQHCSILSGGKQHIKQSAAEYHKLNIGDNVWIGANAVIMSNLDNNVIVGAGSVVTKPVGSNLTVVGNPARIIRYEGIISR